MRCFLLLSYGVSEEADEIKESEELSEGLNIDKATTCRAIKKLEEAEFLTRVKDKNDTQEILQTALSIISGS